MASTTSTETEMIQTEPKQEPGGKSLTCADCGSALGRSLFTLWEANDYPCMNTEKPCQAHLCAVCINKHPLYTVPQAQGKPYKLEYSQVNKFCNPCFQEKSVVDFSRTYDTIEGSSGVIFVFVHGGAGCRGLFQPHAQELNQRFGHGSILLDLPGHASMLHTELSLDSCVETVASVLKASGITKGSKEKAFMLDLLWGRTLESTF